MVRNIVFVNVIILFLISPFTSNAQEMNTVNPDLLLGNWEGAFIKGNSYQKFDISFFKNDSILMSNQIIEEWHPQFGEFQLPVETDSTGYISFNTGYGRAKTQLDKVSLEINGHIIDKNPTIYVHFKKVPLPSKPKVIVEPVEVTHGKVSIKGHLHIPENSKNKTVIIIVGGRGCYAGNTEYDLFSKLLSKYKISTFSYHKRGTGKSTGDCNTATIDDLAKDLIEIKSFLKNHPNNYSNIGVIGSSAGGWVMMKASEYTNFDFLMSIVGPSTTVREQQMQSLEKGISKFNLTDLALKELTEYTNLVFDAEVNQDSFDKFSELLRSSEENGWNNLLDGTDIPKNVNDIEKLWVRRHNYDPTNAYIKCNIPLLAIYGENDWIVPFNENINKLKALFTGEREMYLNTFILPEAEHGTEIMEGYRNLNFDKSYWRFFRISPYVQIEIINFLNKYKFIDQ